MFTTRYSLNTNHHVFKHAKKPLYYIKVGDAVLKEAKDKISSLVREAYDNEILSKDEFRAMMPIEEQKTILGRFYCTFKVHKKYEHGRAPPPRGIVSCSGTLTENIAIYVEHHLKEVATTHESYLQDTPDFLRNIDKLNQQGELPPNALLVVVDAIGLYDNIPPKEGVECVGEVLTEK